MKPITVRSTDGVRPQRSTSCRSSPGAERPVQEVTIRWVMRAGIDPEPVDGRLSQRRRLDLVAAHPGAGRGKVAADVEAVGVNGAVAEVGRGLEGRPPSFDLTSLGHAAEHLAGATLCQKRVGEANEGLVHVVGRNGRRDAVEEGHG